MDFGITGVDLALRKKPLIYMGKENTLYNTELKNIQQGKIIETYIMRTDDYLIIKKRT